MKKNAVLYILALLGCFLLGCGGALCLKMIDSRTITPLSGGQTWDQSAFGFTMRVPEDAAIFDHTRENAELGGNALYAGSSTGKDGALYLFCYANETGDRLSDYPDQDVVSYYMNAGASSVRTRMIAGRRFVCYRAHVLTEEGEQAWDTYETWDETLQITFETQMDESVVLSILATLEFSTN
ncbi:MAG: hypothetical protein E7321_06385 [Clostridiales bacterium]|nr:hypothetical protein [Clostridiales bacterium]